MLWFGFASLTPDLITDQQFTYVIARHFSVRHQIVHVPQQAFVQIIEEQFAYIIFCDMILLHVHVHKL